MNEITLHHSTDSAHRVVGHNGKCARLHGHTYHWTVTVQSSALGSPEFVVDFAAIKDVLNAWDHKCLLWQEDELAVIDTTSDEQLRADRRPTEDAEALFGVVRLPVNPTSEQLSLLAARMILANAREDNPTVGSVTVVCSETPKSSAVATVSAWQ